MPSSCIGPYTIERELGRGGMGEVFLARDSRLDRYVAIKALPAHLAASPDRLARFQREARVLALLNHPGIGAIYGLEECEGAQYLVLEYLEGRTLAAQLLRGALPVTEALSIAGQIAAALAVAHEKGVVHRDLKPGNIMLLPDGRVKVLDFGLARLVEGPESDAPARPEPVSLAPTIAAPRHNNSPTHIGEVMGTGGYMSPEQARGRTVDLRSDVFSFGCVLCELLCGAPPFTGDSLAEIIGATLHKDVDFARLPAGVPASVRQLLQHCLEKDPAKRCDSASAIARELAGMHRWANDVAVPQLVSLCERILVWEEGRESWTAFELAAEIDRIVPGHAVVERLRPEFSSPISITTDPPGTRAFAAYYADGDEQEIDLGTTPLSEIQFPRGLSRIRLELPGHRATYDLVWSIKTTSSNATDPAKCTWHYRLFKPGEIPDEMELVPAGSYAMLLTGLDEAGRISTGAFLMDRHAVTNRQYKAFVDDRGYSRPEFWLEPFVVGEQSITREEAMARFVDSVGHPGPAKWEMGDYPAGEDDHPVAGVCWYEAAAYAAWAGKSLPTIFHWNRVAFTHASGQIATPANFSGRGTVPVGSTRSINRFGIHDLAGNVREWMLNASSRPGYRFILGGGWNDPNYAFIDSYAQPAFDRSAANGFRCMRATEPDPEGTNLAGVQTVAFRDYRQEKPVGEEVFAFLLRQFQYDRGPLHAVLESEQPYGAARWRTYEINAAYGGERMRVHVFLPDRARPPYQTVLLFPGSLALHTRAFTTYEVDRIDYVIKSGRALVLPIFKGTYERGSELQSDWPQPTSLYKDHVIMWGKDVGRSVDLIESLPDLDAAKLALFGVSWGGALGAIMPAVEPRLRVVILYIAGFAMQRPFPECDQINFAPRVRQPTLMINGEIDYYFPLETSQRPMFEMLGTPPELKKWKTYVRGHSVPKVELIRESLAWLDQHLGPVKG